MQFLSTQNFSIKDFHLLFCNLMKNILNQNHSTRILFFFDLSEEMIELKVQKIYDF